MTVNRISTYALHQSTLRDASKIQASLGRLQTQLSSGLKSQDFEGIASQAEQFLSLENRIARSNTFLDNNKLVKTRIESTGGALDQIIDIANDLKNLIALRRNATSGAETGFELQVEGKWKALTEQLNITLEGRYLFSGDSTNLPAVDGDNFPILLQNGVPDDSYYQGSRQDVTLQADENTTMTYNVRADHEAFQKLFAGLAMAKQGNQNNSDADLQAAFDLVQQGLQGTIAVQATVNANKVELDQINLRQQSLQLYWKGVKEEIVNTDLVAVSTQVAIDQGILQASFQAFARINSLRLSDFLQ
jgi:flagellar hook-associated protein 3 FlgL